jgi:phospholipase C
MCPEGLGDVPWERKGAIVVRWRLTLAHLFLATLGVACSGTQSSSAPTAQGLNKVNHIIVLMMENHSFDNYFGALAYAPGSPYHASSAGCAADDHGCVDGLSCSVGSAGDVVCTNSNADDAGGPVVAFHASSRCVVPDLAHSWQQSHLEANFNDPNGTLLGSPNDGFVRVNDVAERPDNGVETATEDPTMGFYTQDDLPLYYDLAQKFAIDDRYFASVIGPTLPNRFYLMTATSFGHVTSNDTFPPGVLKPISGSIFDLLDRGGVSWTDYYQDGPQAGAFRQPSGSATDPHFQSVQNFLAVAAGSAGAGQLPQVSLIDASGENDDHPPADIQRGQAFVSSVINALRSGPYWKDSVVFITYDEHGGFYDHVMPPPAPQGSARTPDGISPGQCADLSNPPASQQSGGGVGCSASVSEAHSMCPALAPNPNGPFPGSCASFDQLGFRVPLLVVSPFARAHYVSHTVGDHTSLLAFIEKRFLSDGGGSPLHLTLRDQYADTLEDLFDFDNAPSLNTLVSRAQLPAMDCTPLGT